MDSARYLEFDPRQAPLPARMKQIVPGRIGGKARGLLFAASLIESNPERIGGEYTRLVDIPQSFMIGTDLFDAFIDYNGLDAVIRHGEEKDIDEAFERARIPDRFCSALQQLLTQISGPVAVRSSSLLEDSPEHSFAGLFLTLFIPNRGDAVSRMSEFERAIQRVLASTYNPNAAVYRKKHGLRIGEEKMAILVQPMIGQRHAELFYPLLGGVAFSKNFYPWTDRLNREHGVVRLVFGLGTRAVGRNYARVFSLTDPRLRPEGTSIRDILKYSQEIFDSLDLDTGALVSRPARDALGLHNHLHKISSVLKEDSYLVETPLPFTPRDRFVLTFDPLILSDRYLPLVPIVRTMLRNLEHEFGLPVDIEFAADLSDDRRESVPGIFHLLQVRPMGVRREHRRIPMPPVEADRILIDSQRAMGNGILEGVKDIVFVAPEKYSRERPGEVRREVAYLNSKLAGTNYILIGPGRWGSTNPQLGVPVSYADISNAAVIVEVSGGKFAPELSFGTHFFGDLLADGTLFLSVIPEREDLFRRDLLTVRPTSSSIGEKHFHFPEGLTVRVDGDTHRGQIFLANL